MKSFFWGVTILFLSPKLFHLALFLIEGLKIKKKSLCTNSDFLDLTKMFWFIIMYLINLTNSIEIKLQIYN